METLAQMLEDYRNGERYFPSYEELVALVASQVVADERAAFEVWWNARVRQSGDSLHATEFAYAIWSAARAAAPVQPVAVPDAVIVLLNHIESVVDDQNWQNIDHKLWNAVTMLAVQPAKSSVIPEVYAVLQSLHAALSQRCAEQDQYAREGMLKAINTVEREMLKFGKDAAPAAQGDAPKLQFKTSPTFYTVQAKANCEFIANDTVFHGDGISRNNPITYLPVGNMRIDLSGWECFAPGAEVAQGDAWREKCEALLDIWDDGNKPEDERAYVNDAFPEMLEEIRAAIAAKAASC